MKKNKHRLHPLELAAKNASFDILGYITKRYREAINRKNKQIKPKELWQR